MAVVSGQWAVGSGQLAAVISMWAVGSWQLAAVISHSVAISHQPLTND
ncbi:MULTISPECIES: hypothetical protein [unclassified Microcoleus]